MCVRDVRLCVCADECARARSPSAPAKLHLFQFSIDLRLDGTRFDLNAFILFCALLLSNLDNHERESKRIFFKRLSRAVNERSERANERTNESSELFEEGLLSSIRISGRSGSISSSSSSSKIRSKAVSLRRADSPLTSEF